jgi:hypothetical protein
LETETVVNSVFSSLPCNHKEHTTNSQAGQEHIHPNVWRQGVEEGEDAWIGPIGFSVENADAQGHERLGKVYDFLPHISDGKRSHC